MWYVNMHIFAFNIIKVKVNNVPLNDIKDDRLNFNISKNFQSKIQNFSKKNFLFEIVYNKEKKNIIFSLC